MTEHEQAEVLKLAQAQIEASRAYRAARQAFFDAEAALGPNYVLAHGLAAERRVLAPYHAAYEALAPAMHAADSAMAEYIWALSDPAQPARPAPAPAINMVALAASALGMPARAA